MFASAVKFGTILQQRRDAKWHRQLTTWMRPEDDGLRAMGALRNMVEDEPPAYHFNPRSPLLARPDGKGGFVDAEGIPVAIF